MAMEWVDLDAVERVVVIGAGVAGLQTVRALMRAGFAVTCLEAQDVVGGVWTRNTHGYTLQVPWDLYTFPDFPYPRELVPAGKSATSSELAAYMQAYANHFHLGRHIRLHSRVLEVVASPTGWGKLGGPNTPWLVRYEDVATQKQYALPASMVILATGQFSTPFLPTYQGASRFKGSIVHAKSISNLDVFKGKRVVVVGSGKTGMDLVAEIGAASQADSVTIVYQTSHWCLPETVKGRQMADVLLSQHTTEQLPPYYTHYQTRGSSCFGGASRVPDAELTASQAQFWEQLAAEAQQAMAAPKMAPPNLPLMNDMFNGSQIFDNSWTEFMRHENVSAIQAQVVELTADSVVLTGGQSIPCDILLCCTGYHAHYKFLDEETNRLLNAGQDGLYMYRGMIPPAVPNLLFVGAEATTLNTMLTTSLQSEWVMRLLTGHVALPSRAAMEADVELQRMWRRRVMPAARNRGAVYALYASCYWRQLLKDMGQKAMQGSRWSKRKHAKRALRPSEVAHLITAASLKVTARGSSLKCTRHHRLAVTLGGVHHSSEVPGASAAAIPASDMGVVPDGTEECSAGRPTAEATSVVGRLSLAAVNLVGRGSARNSSSRLSVMGNAAAEEPLPPRTSDLGSRSSPVRLTTMTLELLADHPRHESDATGMYAGQDGHLVDCAGSLKGPSPDSQCRTGLVPLQAHEPPICKDVVQNLAAPSSGGDQRGLAAGSAAHSKDQRSPHRRRSLDHPRVTHAPFHRPSLLSDSAQIDHRADAAQKPGWHWSELLEMGTRSSPSTPRHPVEHKAVERYSQVARATAGLLHARPNVESPQRGQCPSVTQPIHAAHGKVSPIHMGASRHDQPGMGKAALLTDKARDSTTGSDEGSDDRIPAWVARPPMLDGPKPFPALPTMPLVQGAGPVCEGQEAAAAPSSTQLHISWEPAGTASTTATALPAGTAGPVTEGRRSADVAQERAVAAELTAKEKPSAGPWRASAITAGQPTNPPKTPFVGTAEAMVMVDGKWRVATPAQAGSAAQAAQQAIPIPAASSGGSFGLGDRLKAFGSFIRRWSGEFSRGSTPRASFDRSSTYDSQDIITSGGHARSSGSYQRNSGSYQRNSQMAPMGQHVFSHGRPPTVAELRAHGRPEAAGPDRNSGIDQPNLEHQSTRSSGDGSSSHMRSHGALSTHWLTPADDSAPVSACSTLSHSQENISVPAEGQFTQVPGSSTSVSTALPSSSLLQAIPASSCSSNQNSIVIPAVPVVVPATPNLQAPSKAGLLEDARQPSVEHHTMQPGVIEYTQPGGLTFLTSDSNLQRRSAQQHASVPGVEFLNHGSSSGHVFNTQENTRSGVQLSMDEWIDDDGNPNGEGSSAGTSRPSSLQYTVVKPASLLSGSTAPVTTGWPPAPVGGWTSKASGTDGGNRGSGDGMAQRSSEWISQTQHRQVAHTAPHHMNRAMLMHMEEATQADMLPMISEDVKGEKATSSSTHATNSNSAGANNPKPRNAQDSEHVFSFCDAQGADAGPYQFTYHVQPARAASPNKRDQAWAAAHHAQASDATDSPSSISPPGWHEQYSVTSNVLHNLGTHSSPATDYAVDLSGSHASQALRRLSGRVAGMDTEELWPDDSSMPWNTQHMPGRQNPLMATYNSVTSLVLNHLAGGGAWEGSPMNSMAGLRRLSGRVNTGEGVDSSGSCELVKQLGYAPEQYSMTSNVLRNVGGTETPVTGTGASVGGTNWSVVLRRLSGRVEVDCHGRHLSSSMHVPMSAGHTTHASMDSNLADGGGAGEMAMYPRSPRPTAMSRAPPQAVMYTPLVSALVGARQQQAGVMASKHGRRVSWTDLVPFPRADGPRSGVQMISSGGRLQSANGHMPRLRSRLSDCGSVYNSSVVGRDGAAHGSSNGTLSRMPPQTRSSVASGLPASRSFSSASSPMRGRTSPYTKLLTSANFVLVSAPSNILGETTSTAHDDRVASSAQSVASLCASQDADVLPVSAALQFPVPVPADNGDNDNDFHTCPPTPTEAFVSAELVTQQLEDVGQQLEGWHDASSAEELTAGWLAEPSVLMADYVRLLQELGMLPDRLLPNEPSSLARTQQHGPEGSKGLAPGHTTHAAHAGMSIIDQGAGDDSLWMDGHGPYNGTADDAPTSHMPDWQRVQYNRVANQNSRESLASNPSHEVLQRLTGRVLPSGANALQPVPLQHAETSSTASGAVGTAAAGEEGASLQPWSPLDTDDHSQAMTHTFYRLTGRVMPSVANTGANTPSRLGEQSLMATGDMLYTAMHDMQRPMSPDTGHGLQLRNMAHPALNRLTGRVIPSSSNNVQPSDPSHNVLHRLTGRVIPSGSNNIQPVQSSQNVLHRLTGRVMPSGSNALPLAGDSSNNELHRLTGRVMPSGSNALQPVPLSSHHGSLLVDDWDAEDDSMFSGTLLQHGPGFLHNPTLPRASPPAQRTSLGHTNLLKSTSDAAAQMFSMYNNISPAASTDPGAQLVDGIKPVASFQPVRRDVVGQFHAQLCTALLARNPVKEALAELMALSDRLGLPATPTTSHTPVHVSGPNAVGAPGEASSKGSPQDLVTLDPGLLAALQLDIAGLPDRLAAALAPFSTGLIAGPQVAGNGSSGGPVGAGLPPLPPTRSDEPWQGRGRCGRNSYSSMPGQQRPAMTRQDHADNTSSLDASVLPCTAGSRVPVKQRSLPRSINSGSPQHPNQPAAGGARAMGLLLHDVSLLTSRLTAKLQQTHHRTDAADNSTQAPAQPQLLVHASASSFTLGSGSATHFSRSSTPTPGDVTAPEDATDGLVTLQPPTQRTSSNSTQQSGTPPAPSIVTADEDPSASAAHSSGAWVDQVLTRLLLQDLDGLPERVLSHHSIATAAEVELLQQRPTGHPRLGRTASTGSRMYAPLDSLQQQMSNAGVVHSASHAAVRGPHSSSPPPHNNPPEPHVSHATYQDVVANLLLAAERDMGTLAAAMSRATSPGVQEYSPAPSHQPHAQVSIINRSHVGSMSSRSSANDMPTLRRLAGRVAPSTAVSQDVNAVYSGSFGINRGFTLSSRPDSSTGTPSTTNHMGTAPPTWMRRAAVWDAQATDASSSGMNAPVTMPAPGHAAPQVPSMNGVTIPPVTGFGRMVHRAWGPEDDRDSTEGSDYMGLASALRSQPGPGGAGDALDGVEEPLDTGGLYPSGDFQYPSQFPSGNGAIPSNWHNTLASNNSSLSLVLRRLSGRLMDSHPMTPSRCNTFPTQQGGNQTRGWE